MATKAKKEVAVATEKETKKVVKKTAVKKVAEVKKAAPKKAVAKNELQEAKTPEVKTAKVKAEKKVVEKKTPVKKSAEAKTPIIKKSKTQKTEVDEVKGEVLETKEEKVETKVKEVEEPKKEYPRTETSVEELFEAGAHYGHVVKKWNPKMKKYLWGARNGIHIFDLEKTVAGIAEATKDLAEMAAAGKRIVLVGTKRQVRQMVEEEAKRLNIPFITQRWMGGLITNWKQLKLTLDRLNSLKSQRESGQLKKYTKKEQLLFDKEINKLERIVGGIAMLKEAPEVVVVFDTHKEKLAVKEASSREVKVIGLVDSNANPDPIDYIIPMNDDSAKGLEILVRVLGQAIENGLNARKEVAK